MALGEAVARVKRGERRRFLVGTGHGGCTCEAARFLQRTVKTGEEASTGYRVLEGLKSGDMVVTDGSFLLRAEAIRQHP